MIVLITLFLFILVVTITGWSYGIFLFARMFLSDWAAYGLRNQPARIFGASLGYSSGLTVVAYFIVYISLEQFGPISILLGFLGCIFLFMRKEKNSHKDRIALAAVRKEHPISKQQLWLQDLLIAALVLGLSLSILVGCAPVGLLSTSGILYCALYFSCCILIGCFIVADVFRHCPSLQQPVLRGGYQFGVLCVFIILPSSGYVAWRAWQHVRWTLEKPPKPLRRSKLK